MQFHLAKKSDEAYVIDSVSKKVFGPFHSGATMRAFAKAFEVGHLQHRFTRVPVQDLRLFTTSDYNESVDESDVNGYNLRPLLKEDPIPSFVVRWIRKKLQLTQKDCAELIGVKESTVQSWEIGERVCSGPAKLALIEALENN